MNKFIIIVLIAILFNGCTNTGVINISKNIYKIKNIDKSGMFGNNGADLEDEVFREAKNYANKQNKIFKPLDKRFISMAAGRFASFELKFKLLNKPIIQMIGTDIPSEYDNFKSYIANNSTDKFEGIWENDDGQYTLGLIKTNNDSRFRYKMFIIETKNDNWKSREIKVKFSNLRNGKLTKSQYLMEDRSENNLLCEVKDDYIKCNSRKIKNNITFIKVFSPVNSQNKYVLNNDNQLENKLSIIKQLENNNTKWLINIGIERYEYSDNIKYSKHSSEFFTKVLQKTLGIPKYNTLSLIDDKATMGRIKIKIKKLLRKVKKDDTIYFYYNGHGIPIVSQQNEPYILPSDVEPDFIQEDNFFKLSNIYKLLSDSKATKIVAFIDSCFSGATDGKSIIKGVAASRLVPKKVTFDKSKMVVLTAGKDKQYSNMYEEKGHRLFSYFVMKSLLKGKTDINDIYREVYTNVKDESYKMGDMKIQEPTIDGNLKLKL